MLENVRRLFRPALLLLLERTVFRKMTITEVEIDLRMRESAVDWIKASSYVSIFPDDLKHLTLEIPTSSRGKQKVFLFCFHRSLPPHLVVQYLRAKGFEPGVYDHLLAVEALARPSTQSSIIAPGTVRQITFLEKERLSCPMVYYGDPAPGRTLTMTDMSHSTSSDAYFIATRDPFAAQAARSVLGQPPPGGAMEFDSVR